MPYTRINRYTNILLCRTGDKNVRDNNSSFLKDQLDRELQDESSERKLWLSSEFICAHPTFHPLMQNTSDQYAGIYDLYLLETFIAEAKGSCSED